MRNDFCVHPLSEASRTNWQGGVTWELALGPEETAYARRDFLYRISSARVDLEESVFTSLPDYHRIILPLDGTLTLYHDGGNPVILPPLTVHAFDGGADTLSRGKVRDFNLMLRKGQCLGGVQVLRLLPGSEIVLPDFPGCLCRLFFGVRGETMLILNDSNLTLPSDAFLETRGQRTSVYAREAAELLIAWVVPQRA